MNKLAIVLDSFSGKDRKFVEALEHHYYIPLKVVVNGKEYLDDGSEVSTEELMKQIDSATDVKTSQPSPATIEELFNKLSKEYEQVIYLPLGSALSGTYQTANMIAADYENIFVLNNVFVGAEFFELSKFLIKEAQTKSAEELILIAKSYAEDSQPTFVIPRDIDAFIRGGRLGKAVAWALEKLNAVPIISYEDTEKLHKKMVKRSGERAADFAIEKLSEIKAAKGEGYEWLICHTIDEKTALYAKAELEAKGFKVHYELTNNIIAAHTGNGAFSLGFFKKLG